MHALWTFLYQSNTLHAAGNSEQYFECAAAGDLQQPHGWAQIQFEAARILALKEITVCINSIESRLLDHVTVIPVSRDAAMFFSAFGKYVCVELCRIRSM